MDALPDNTALSAEYCNRWSGILNMDGKYIAVKRYAKKIPFIWCVDFLQHDFPVGILATAESYEAYLKVFRLLKTMNYPLQVVICDDVEALKMAAKHYYPKVKVQLCHTHYIENIRQLLHLRTTGKGNPVLSHFFNSMIKHVFVDPTNRTQREQGILHVLEQRTDGNPLLQGIMIDIAKRYDELFCYENIPHCPKTNNIIESFNSHLNARLKSIKGFQSFHSAERFLNAYLIRRRTKPFTDCDTPFKHFNGKMPLQNTIKKQAPWPEIPGVQEPETER